MAAAAQLASCPAGSTRRALLSDAHAYDAASDAWTSLLPMPTARRSAAAASSPARRRGSATPSAGTMTADDDVGRRVQRDQRVVAAFEFAERAVDMAAA